MVSRPPALPRELIAGAAGLLGLSRLDATLARGAVVIVVTAGGVPVVGHNLTQRAHLPALLRTIADGVEAGSPDD